MISKDDVTVVLPVLDEELGVSAVLDELAQEGFRNVLVVDGYSTDNTVEAARRKGVAVILQHGRGKTGAIRTAIEQVSTPYMLVMDGDYTYNAADIERFLSHAKEYDQIVGARKRENVSALHRFGNRVISSTFNLLFGTNISDVCSGMYLLNTRATRSLTFRTGGFSVEVELLAQMALQGHGVTEVPISYRERIGTAKLSTWIGGINILKAVFGLAMLYNPVFVFSIAAACAAIPGIALISWVLLQWLATGTFRSGWALGGIMLLLLSTQALTVGTIGILLKRAEIRIERLVRTDIDVHHQNDVDFKREQSLETR